MSATTTETETSKAQTGSLAWSYEKLCEWTRKRGDDAQKRIMAHIRARTGKNLALPLFHRDPSITDDQKKALYKECIAALVNGNYTNLQGAVGHGDKTVEQSEVTSPPSVPAEIKRATQPAKAESPTTTARVVKPPPLNAPTVPPVVPEVKILDGLPPLDPVTNAMLGAMRPHIERIVDDRIKHGLGNGAFPTERVQELVDARVKLAGTITPEIVAALSSLLTAIQHSLNPQSK